MSTLSTHVLNTGSGRPAAGIVVTLARLAFGEEVEVSIGTTDEEGRIRFEEELDVDTYQLTFEVHPYLGDDAFYRQIPIVFHIADAGAHYHVPLLLSQYGYTTYRGS